MTGLRIIKLIYEVMYFCITITTGLKLPPNDLKQPLQLYESEIQNELGWVAGV